MCRNNGKGELLFERVLIDLSPLWIFTSNVYCLRRCKSQLCTGLLIPVNAQVKKNGIE